MLDARSTIVGQPSLRCDLATAHRLAALEGFTEALQNHMSVYVGEPEPHLLVTPGETHWSTVAEEDILTLNAAGRVVGGDREPNGGTFVVHWPLHVARPDLSCLMHTHALYSTALFMRHGRKLNSRASQAAMMFHDDVAYHDVYDGALFDAEDGRAMARSLGQAHVLVLRNHGVVVGGKTIGEAYNRMYLFERACRMQLLAESNGSPLNLIPEHVVLRNCAELRRITEDRRARGFEPDPSWNGWKSYLTSRAGKIDEVARPGVCEMPTHSDCALNRDASCLHRCSRA